MRKILQIIYCGFFVALCLFCISVSPAFAIDNSVTQPSLYPLQYSEQKISQVMDEYKNISADPIICVALDLLKGTKGDYSRRVIMGENPTNKSIKVVFKNLSAINPTLGNVNALGMKKGSQIYIYINDKHKDAPVIAISSIIAHEALHQDAFNSLAEETYAWTTEAIVWQELVAQYQQYENNLHPLACRERTLALLYKKGGETDKYIKQIVYSSFNYENLPETSPGFSAL